MEEEGEVNSIKGQPSPDKSPLFFKASNLDNWSHLTCTVSLPDPKTTLPSSTSPFPLGLAGHALQTKVKVRRGEERCSDQWRPKGRERDKEWEDSKGRQFKIGGTTLTQTLVRPKVRVQGTVSPLRISSSSEDEEEVGVEVKLQVHSQPDEPQSEQEGWEIKGIAEGGEETKEEGGSAGSVVEQPRELGEGADVENSKSYSASSTKGWTTPPTLASAPSSISSTNFSSSSSSTRHWAPPKGFWRVARPETLRLNSVGPNTITTLLPLKDYTQIPAVAEPQTRSRSADTGTGCAILGTFGEDDTLFDLQHSDSLDDYLDRCDQRDQLNPVGGLWRADSLESVCSQGRDLTVGERVEANQRARGRSRDRRRSSKREEEGHCETESSFSFDDNPYKRDKGFSGYQNDNLEPANRPKMLQPHQRSFFTTSEELPLSARHEQAKILLERARLKAQSNHVKGERPTRRSHSDQRYNSKRQPSGPSVSIAIQTAAVAKPKEEPAPPTPSGLLVPLGKDSSPANLGTRSRRHGHSPTRVRFVDESEKEAESRYQARVRERGNSKAKSGGDKNDRNGTKAPQRPEEVNVTSEPFIREIIVMVKKCEACGSVVRDPPIEAPVPQTAEPQQPANAEDPRGKKVPRWVPPTQAEQSATRSKAPLMVTLARALVMGEDNDSGTGWRSSGFGKLRRRSRKGESRVEAGHGPYGPSWAQRRNSNPRARVKDGDRAVTFAPGSPITLEPHLLGAIGYSAAPKDTPTPPPPLKSALKSSSKASGTAAGQPSVQFRLVPQNIVNSDGASQLLASAEAPEACGETPVVSVQGSASSASLVPCIRPSSLRYSPARLTSDLPPAELWDSTTDGTGGDPSVSDSDGRQGLRGLGVSRAEDLRAELLRSEHLKAEATWEDGSEGRRSMAERDGRPKLSLRRFFSSIGLNSVGRLVKGGRSSSMEQLSVPMPSRTNSASPTRRQLSTVRLQRTPSLQTLNTVSPLAQLRKASSVQSLERRTERSTILGELQLPYGLAPRNELQRTLSMENVLASGVGRIVLASPVGRIVKVLPDGTLLLELTRPPNEPFGFLISRGKSRPDTGVYVEQAGEGLYIGLLGVGDEILEVNGEGVAGLTLDQVTRLMTRDSTASIRTLPYRRKRL